MKRISLTALLSTLGYGGLLHTATAAPEDHVLWSDQPVIVSEAAAKSLRTLDQIWSQEIYPIGNGRLGCTVFGDPEVERI